MHYMIFHYIMLLVFRSNHHCFWKFHKFHRKTLVLESLFFLEMMKLYNNICFAWISCTSAEFFSHRLMSWMSQKYNRSFVILRRTFLWIFEKLFMKTLKKKKRSFYNKNIYIYIYIWVTDIMSFILYIFWRVFLSLKKSLCLSSSVYA